MDPEEIKKLIESGIPGSEAYVTGEQGKYEAIVVSDAFQDLSMVKEQQLVYGTVNEQIASGALHAITIKAYTPEEWQERQT